MAQQVLDFPKSYSQTITYHQLVNERGLQPAEVKKLILSLDPREAAALQYDWRFWARPGQTPPDWDWRTWLLKGGRGSGKTWVGANLTNEKARVCHRLALIGRTASDVRDTMIEGDSGIIALSPPWFMPKYEPGKRRVTWPNGAFALCFSADEPNLLRGPQFEFVWADELAAWRRLKETLDNIMLCLRKGTNPQLVATTTPRPLQIIKDMIKRATTHTTTESTYANLENLAVQWAEEVINTYANTRLGRQELEGSILDDNPNALWSRECIDKHRVTKYPDLDAITVGVDPMVKEDPDDKSAEAGIIIAGRKGRKRDPHAQAYIIDDMSMQGSPEEWATQAVSAYYKYKADKIVAEANNGGAMVKSTIQAIDPHVPVELVWASRGKVIRAEPVATLNQRGRVHHTQYLPECEDQLCEWEPGMKSPDRLDAYVWTLTDLMLGELETTRPYHSAAR